MFLDLLFLTDCVIGGCELLGYFFSKQVFEELRLLDAGFSSKASGLDFDLSVVLDIDNYLFHVVFLQQCICLWMLIWIALNGYTGGMRRFWN